jgi:hypothetical protein
MDKVLAFFGCVVLSSCILAVVLAVSNGAKLF